MSWLAQHRLNGTKQESAPEPFALSASAERAAQSIRGSDWPPAIMVHGVLSRSGTVYTGEILRLHPDVEAYPNDIWEFPLLSFSADIGKLQRQFIERYPPNRERFESGDFVALVGSALLAYLHAFVPAHRHILLKVPDVTGLRDFRLMFPNENLLLLLRDGRDVVASTLKTWPRRDFAEVTQQWTTSARTMLDFDSALNEETKSVKYLFARYEQILEDPPAFVRDACRRFQLASARYPFHQIESIPVMGSSTLRKEGKVTWDPISKPRDFHPVGRWHEWSRDRKRVFKRIAGQTLIDCGYTRGFDW